MTIRFLGFTRVTFFLVNQVEHQKLNLSTGAAELPFDWVFGVQHGVPQTQALNTTYYITQLSKLIALLELSSINGVLIMIM